MAEAHFEAGQSSIKHFRRAMAMNTSSDLFDNSRFFMKLGQAYLEKGKREKAFHCFNDAQGNEAQECKQKLTLSRAILQNLTKRQYFSENSIVNLLLQLCSSKEVSLAPENIYWLDEGKVRFLNKTSKKVSVKEVGQLLLTMCTVTRLDRKKSGEPFIPVFYSRALKELILDCLQNNLTPE